MIRKLQIKFVCVTMTMVTLMLVIMMGMQYRSTKFSLESDSLTALESAAMGIMPGNRPGQIGQSTSQPCFTISSTGRGDFLISGSEYYDLTDTQILQQLYLQAMEAGTQSGVLSAYNLRFYRAETPFGVRYAFTDITAEIATLNNLVKSCILIGIVSFFAFLGLTVALSRWMVRPVEKAWQQQRQFVADASHELKTPLTVILTNAELLQDDSCEVQAKEQFAGNILAMSHQMRGLVESLLQLARADSGQTRAEVCLIDYSHLVEDAALPFEPVYFERDLMLESSIEPGLQVCGSAIHLRQVVEILLDNGQKYSDPGVVQLSLSRHGRNQALLRLSTPGQELTARQREDIFKRFYRVDEARSRNGSYGLGLSIAQRIVEDHRGRIWAESGEGRNTFCVTLPLV